MQNYFETVTPPFFTADFDYFRISREKWNLMLIRLGQMGVNMITLTVPWGFHEFNRSTNDFAGTTNARRDITGVLDLCDALNFHCILNPGPYSNSGVLGYGLPNWLLDDSDDLDTSMPVAVESWYQAMSKALVGRQWPAGPIIALQISTESGQGPSPTYSQHVTEVKWPIWLRKHYKGIEVLNAAYGATYRTVSDVKFPQTWAQETTPLEKDAKKFLEELQHDTQIRYSQTLANAGWQIPIYSSDRSLPSPLPTRQAHSLIHPSGLSALDLNNTILTLQHPIQVDPDPIDIGSGLVWASNAPIRADGSLRQKFWLIRQYLWQHALPNTHLDGKILNLSFDTGGMATVDNDTILKLNLVKGTKPTAYRLYFNGELLVDNNLKAARGKLSGLYVAEDDADQTDLILFLNDPTVPLTGFPLTYLRNLLVAQAQTLVRCAALATELGQIFAPTQDRPDMAPLDSSAPTSYSLGEARRGLSEADVALRKAMASIGELEAGFGIILGKTEVPPPQPARPAIAIRPEIFEGVAGDILLEAGNICLDIAPQLKSAAETVQNTLDRPNGFTLEQYQQSYTAAVTAAQTSRDLLLKIIARLRIEIASERLPLVIWRIHDQIQGIAGSLRWGVVRG